MGVARVIPKLQTISHGLEYARAGNFQTNSRWPDRPGRRTAGLSIRDCQRFKTVLNCVDGGRVQCVAYTEVPFELYSGHSYPPPPQGNCSFTYHVRAGCKLQLVMYYHTPSTKSN